MSLIPDFPQNLLDLHHTWHQPGAHPGGGPGRVIPAGAPGSGLEFLAFHRNFVAQFHAWYDAQPSADQAAVAAWTAIPAALKNPAVTFWNSNLAGQEARIVSNAPPFATADELGIFIENGIHNWIHGASAAAFNEAEVGTFDAPRSTYFYQIHGLVDLWWQRWVRAQKSRLKDIVDTKRNLKETLKEKELLKDVKEKEIPEKMVQDKVLKEKETKEAKEKEKETKEKEKETKEKEKEEKEAPEKLVPDKALKEKETKEKETKEAKEKEKEAKEKEKETK